MNLCRLISSMAFVGVLAAGAVPRISHANVIYDVSISYLDGWNYSFSMEFLHNETLLEEDDLIGFDVQDKRLSRAGQNIALTDSDRILQLFFNSDTLLLNFASTNEFIGAGKRIVFQTEDELETFQGEEFPVFSDRTVISLRQPAVPPEPPVSNIPEPTTFALLGLALAGLTLSTRKAKHH